jgi:hypothetical protein
MALSGLMLHGGFHVLVSNDAVTTASWLPLMRSLHSPDAVLVAALYSSDRITGDM